MTGERVATTTRSTRVFRWAALCGLALLLLAGQVFALGLGRIEVKSRAGEPLLAEIQVVSSDPSELDQLRARLASPETFRRIGLSAPDAVVSGLEFAVALDARGNPVIRVTTRHGPAPQVRAASSSELSANAIAPRQNTTVTGIDEMPEITAIPEIE